MLPFVFAAGAAASAGCVATGGGVGPAARAIDACRGMASGCALREQVRRVCIDVEASEDLNFYDGKAHSLTVLLYALSDPAAFNAAPVSELLAGHAPSGVLEPPVPVTIEPGAKMSLEEVFPAPTRSIGLVADYDRLPDHVEGVEQKAERRIVLPSRCGFLTPSLRLSETRIESS